MPCIAKPKANPQLTTAQLLGSVIRSARDIMRKDKGLNGDADRLPMLTWVLFLKFLDDLEAQCRTVEDRRVLQTRSIAGGEEEPGIQNNFPQDKRTAETALLFLQLIMRKLRKLPPPLRERAGVRGQADCDAQSKEAGAAVVPNGALFGDGVAARVKEALLTEFNLHTVEGGQWLFLEAAARVGGANLSDMIEHGTGINPWVEWARMELAQARGEIYQLPTSRGNYSGILVCLARQEHPDLSVYDDPEIVWRMPKKYHAGLIVASPDAERVRSLLDSYAQRFAQDFLTRAEPWETGRVV